MIAAGDAPGHDPHGSWFRFWLLLSAGVAGHVAWFLFLSTDPWIIGFGDLSAIATGRAVTATGLLLFELVSVLVCASTVRSAATWAPIRRVGRARLAAVVGVHVVLATAVTSTPSHYPLHLALTAVILAAAWLALSGAAEEAGRLHLDPLLDRVLDSTAARWYLAAGAAACALLVNRLVFDGIPHVPDEVVYLLQARSLAAGSLAVDVGGIPAEALDVISTTTVDGHWFGIFPVGWPLVLAVGVRVGAPWLVNPLLTAALVLAAHGLVERVWDRRIANLATLLLALSPWLLLLGGSLMSHTASVLAGVLALRGALEAGRSGRIGAWSLGGGVALGVLVLIRPFEGVLIGLACAAVVAAVTRRLMPSPAAWAFGLVAVAVGASTLAYNRALTGDPLVDPITLYFDTQYYPGSNRLGFGADVGNVGWGNDVLPGHSPLEAAVNGSLNASLVQLELFGWAFGSLAMLLVATLSARAAFDRPTVAALGVVGLVLIGYSLYWYSAADFGARYWSQVVVPLAAATAAALFRMAAAADLRRMAVLASLVGMPVVTIMRGTGKYHDYRGMTNYMAHLEEQAGFGSQDLVLVRGRAFWDYSPALIRNPARLEGPEPLYFRWVEGADLEALRERFPDRRLWIVDGPSITAGEPRVAEGPIP